MSKIILLCCVLAWTLQAQTTVTTTPVALTFTSQAGATTIPAAQTVTLKASTGTPAFTAAVNPANTLWLSVSPASGKLPGSLSVRANPTSMAVGVYNTATVVVTVTGVATPVTIPVTLNVTAPPSTLTLSANTVNVSAPPLPVADQHVMLSTNLAPVPIAVTAGATWLTVSPAVGIVQLGPATDLTISIDASALAPQTAPYVGKITVAVAGGSPATPKSQTITVNLTVNTVAPTITSIWPSTLPVNGGKQTLTIRGTNFYSGTIAKVQGVTAPLKTTTYKDSSTELQAEIPATMLTTATTLKVLVSNPPPGGDSGTSNVTVASMPTVYGVTNSASYSTTAVSPGELVTLFGLNIGPTTPASMVIAAGYVSTAPLSGVSVTIDGKAAPLIYVSQGQVTVQVPYEVATGANKQVSLTNGTNPPATSTVTIAASQPGIYTADGSGSGQAAALNLNTAGQLVLNGSTNLAKIGDTVVLYLTGEGDYAGAPLPGATNTGFIVPLNMNPLPAMKPAPTVKIGGVDATAGISYAGPIPGSMLGILQINVDVPVGSATGVAVPVVVTIGGNASQAGVTLAIHQ